MVHGSLAFPEMQIIYIMIVLQVIGSGRNTQPEVGTPTDRDYSYGDITAKGTTDTTTLIRASDGKVYTSLPPNTESFILGWLSQVMPLIMDMMTIQI